MRESDRSGDDRTRTGDRSPDKRLLLPLSYAPVKRDGAGGIRTHGLELMRLAGTAAPLPRGEGLVGRSRTCGLRRPKPAGWPRSPTTRWIGKHPRRGCSAVSRFSRPGDESSGGRARTCASRLTVARLRRLDHTGTSGGSRIRTCGRSPACALATRCLQPLGHASECERKGRESNPQGLWPTRFRDGVPHPWQPFRGVAPAGVEPAPHRVRVGGSVLLSYEAEKNVTGRDRTCGASRFRRALYRLSYGHGK
jgi:hypothetical protein